MYRFFILSFLLPFYVFSQQDTLLQSSLAIQNDTERVNHLYYHGFALRNKDPQLAYNFAAEAEKSALKSASPRHIAKSYNLLGVLFYKKGDYKTALRYHQSALSIRKNVSDELGIAHSNTNLGNVYSDLKLYAEAERSYLAALDAYRKLDNPPKIIDCLINLGTLKHYMRQYEAAVENYFVALKMIPLNDYETKAMCLGNLAEAYLAKHDTAKALALNQDALEMRQMTEDVFGLGDSYVNTGAIYILTKDYENAKACLDSAYSIGLRYNYADLLLNVDRQFACYYSEIKNFEAAYRWLDKYNTLRDSMEVQQAAVKQQYAFDEHVAIAALSKTTNNSKNAGLLIVMAVFMVGVPFILIQYKR